MSPYWEWVIVACYSNENLSSICNNYFPLSWVHLCSSLQWLFSYIFEKEMSWKLHLCWLLQVNGYLMASICIRSIRSWRVLFVILGFRRMLMRPLCTLWLLNAHSALQFSSAGLYWFWHCFANIICIHYISKSIGSLPFNERFDYFSHFHENKS